MQTTWSGYDLKARIREYTALALVLYLECNMPVEGMCCHLLQSPIPALIPQGSTTGLRLVPVRRPQVRALQGWTTNIRSSVIWTDVLTRPLSVTTDVCLHMVEHLLGIQTQRWVTSTADTGFRVEKWSQGPGRGNEKIWESADLMAVRSHQSQTRSTPPRWAAF